MTVNICVSGASRTWRWCVENLVKSLPGDYYLHTWSNLTTERDLELMVEKYQPVSWFFEPTVDHTEFIENINLPDNNNPNNYMSMFLGMKKAFELVKNSHVVVRTRPDIIHEKPIDFSQYVLESRTVYVPEKGNWFGVNDQFAFGHYDSMQYYCGVYDWLEQANKNFEYFNPECLLKKYLDTHNINIRRVPLEMRIVRPAQVGLTFAQIPLHTVGLRSSKFPKNIEVPFK